MIRCHEDDVYLNHEDEDDEVEDDEDDEDEDDIFSGWDEDDEG